MLTTNCTVGVNPSFGTQMATALRVVLLLAVVLALVGCAAAFDSVKQACDTCGNINMGSGGSKQNYVCPKSAVKDCNININGWCCSKKRVSSKCKACWSLDRNDDDDADDEI